MLWFFFYFFFVEPAHEARVLQVFIVLVQPFSELPEGVDDDTRQQLQHDNHEECVEQVVVDKPHHFESPAVESLQGVRHGVEEEPSHAWIALETPIEGSEETVEHAVAVLVGWVGVNELPVGEDREDIHEEDKEQQGVENLSFWKPI